VPGCELARLGTRTGSDGSTDGSGARDGDAGDEGRADGVASGGRGDPDGFGFLAAGVAGIAEAHRRAGSVSSSVLDRSLVTAEERDVAHTLNQVKRRFNRVISRYEDQKPGPQTPWMP
jgi:hypothetical protein